MAEGTVPIRILHLEDSDNDFELVSQTLDSEGLNCFFKRAENREAFEKALGEGTFDLIICDNTLPTFDGLTATKLARSVHPDTPVLLISGTITEQQAVTCLRQGVTDYLLKGHLERLGPAVRRALVESAEQKGHREADRKLRESEERFRQLAEQSSDGFWFTSVNPEKVLYVSPALERLWGLAAQSFYDEPRGWASSIHPDDSARVCEAWTACLENRSARYEVEYRIFRPNQELRWVAVSATPIRNATGEIFQIGGVARDITERKHTENQRLRTQRLESIGTLAGGVAHDLNNALAPILMVAELLRAQYPNETELIDTIEASAKRGAGMVRQLLTFAKGVDGERLPIQCQHLMREMAKIVQGTFPKTIKLVLKIPQELPITVGDSTQLHQVLLNLCVNARDAMPKGGTLVLEAEARTIDDSFVKSVEGAKHGNYVVIRVSDTGTGIPPEILDRICEPFFTTKGPEQGTGLGLSTVSGIVKGHGGFLQVESHPGKGSVFSVFLPVRVTRAAIEAAPKADSFFQGNGEMVLIVDDEAAVRDASRRVLQKLNFKVITAADGADALISILEHRTEVSAIITDLHMPQMDGLAFVRTISRILPTTPIIVSSGRIEEQQTNELKELGVTAILEKPFTESQLAATLRQAFAALPPSTENSGLDREFETTPLGSLSFPNRT